MKILIGLFLALVTIPAFCANDIPDKYDMAHSRYREINGKVLDFQDIIRWHNEYDYYLKKVGGIMGYGISGNPLRISVKVATDSGSRLPLIGAQRR